jgi:hypothetical protein
MILGSAGFNSISGSAFFLAWLLGAGVGAASAAEGSGGAAVCAAGWLATGGTGAIGIAGILGGALGSSR